MPLNLREPRDLSEKTQWLKLYDRSPLHTICADKVRAREYVASRIGRSRLVPLRHVFYDPNEIGPDRIPEASFALKTNHDTGGVFLCEDRDTFDWAAVRKDASRRMATNMYYPFREWQYKGIRPAVLVEDLLVAENGGTICELKFYCFHGRPGFVQVVLDRFEERRDATYSPEWERMACVGGAPEMEEEVPRPPGLDRLLRDAAALAEPFVFVRIDFLFDGKRAHFGEITFHYGAGLVRYEPPAYERRFGDMVDLSRLPETRRLQLELAQEVEARWRERSGAPI
jgi:hypothetical protein